MKRTVRHDERGRVMQRRVMQETFLKILAIALLMSLGAFGQSLGDIARENRDKQDADERTIHGKAEGNHKRGPSQESGCKPGAARGTAGSQRGGEQSGG